MTNDALTDRVMTHVKALCAMQPDRHVGSPGNREANEYVARHLAEKGFAVERLPFECVDWEPGEAWAVVSGERVELRPGPYSLPVRTDAVLAGASSLAELAAMPEAGDRVLLLHGPLTSDQLTPRNYPFYSFERHTEIIAELDRLSPLAIIAATTANPGVVGALSPYPYIEDADVDIPSAYLHADEAAPLLAAIGGPIRLHVDSRRMPAASEQVVGTYGSSGPRLVVSAHIDARFGTPGALDNATGVACLLALADLVAEKGGLSRCRLELVPFNGEDNFGAYGEIAYIEAGGGSFDDVALAINIDAAGYRGDPTAVSFYGVEDDLASGVRALMQSYPGVGEGEPWPQSDHMVFAMRGVQALAVTSGDLMKLASEYTHTARDVPALVDPRLISEAARYLLDVLSLVEERLAQV